MDIAAAIPAFLGTAIQIYHVVSDMLEAGDARSKLRAEIGALNITLQDLADFVVQPSIAENQFLMHAVRRIFDPSEPFATLVEERMEALRIKIESEEETQLVSGHPHKRSALGRGISKAKTMVKWAVVKKEAQELLIVIERFKSLMSLALQTDHVYVFACFPLR